MIVNYFRQPKIPKENLPFQVIVVVKYLFQFDFFPWNQVARLKAPFWPPRIIGVEKKDRYAVYDLALLLVVFFHRSVKQVVGVGGGGEGRGED